MHIAVKEIILLILTPKDRSIDVGRHEQYTFSGMSPMYSGILLSLSQYPSNLVQGIGGRKVFALLGQFLT